MVGDSKVSCAASGQNNTSSIFPFVVCIIPTHITGFETTRYADRHAPLPPPHNDTTGPFCPRSSQNGTPYIFRSATKRGESPRDRRFWLRPPLQGDSYHFFHAIDVRKMLRSCEPTGNQVGSKRGFCPTIIISVVFYPTIITRVVFYPTIIIRLRLRPKLRWVTNP